MYISINYNYLHCNMACSKESNRVIRKNINNDNVYRLKSFVVKTIRIILFVIKIILNKKLWFYFITRLDLLLYKNNNIIKLKIQRTINVINLFISNHFKCLFR
jgi:hypothetical protein